MKKAISLIFIISTAMITSNMTGMFIVRRLATQAPKRMKVRNFHQKPHLQLDETNQTVKTIDSNTNLLKLLLNVQDIPTFPQFQHHNGFLIEKHSFEAMENSFLQSSKLVNDIQKTLNENQLPDYVNPQALTRITKEIQEYVTNNKGLYKKFRSDNCETLQDYKVYLDLPYQNFSGRFNAKCDYYYNLLQRRYLLQSPYFKEYTKDLAQNYRNIDMTKKRFLEEINRSIKQKEDPQIRE